MPQLLNFWPHRQGSATSHPIRKSCDVRQLVRLYWRVRRISKSLCRHPPQWRNLHILSATPGPGFSQNPFSENRQLLSPQPLAQITFSLFVAKTPFFRFRAQKAGYVRPRALHYP